MSGSFNERVLDLLERADQRFADADEALADGDLAGYQENTAAAQRLISQAVTLAESQQEDAPAGDN